MRGSSWLAEEMLASLEGIYSMELVIWLVGQLFIYDLQAEYT